MARRDGRGAPVSTPSQQVQCAREHVVMLSHGGSACASWRSPMAPPPVEDEHATGSGWLERTDPEWALAWSHFPDPVMAHPVSGECLQYMGSAQYPGRGWVHVFRHRLVPGSDVKIVMNHRKTSATVEGTRPHGERKHVGKSCLAPKHPESGTRRRA